MNSQITKNNHFCCVNADHRHHKGFLALGIN